MAKDPVLPLYYNDISSTTLDWTDEEFGAYMRLLIYQWDKGGLPKDYQRLTRIATSLSTTWPMIQKKFIEEDGILKNPVMEAIRNKRLIHKQKQKENIEKRYQNATKPSTKPPTKNLPLENENEIEKEMQRIEKEEFEKFWNEYDKKVGDKTKVFKKWQTISNSDKAAIMLYIPEYKRAKPDKQFRRDPMTFLNNSTWKDELIFSNGNKDKPIIAKSAGALQLLGSLQAEMDSERRSG